MKRSRSLGSRWWLVLSALLLAALAGESALAAPGAVVRRPWRVLEASGVRRDGQREPLISGDLLAPGARLSLRAGASVHLTQAGDLLLSVVGPAELTLGALKTPRRLELRRARALQLSGMGGQLVFADGRRVQLARSGGTLLVTAGKPYLRRGGARLHRPASASATTAPTADATRAASSATLQIDKAPAWAVAAVSRYRAPARWRRRSGVSLAAAVKRVRGWTAARQQQAREMASCGCTEGSGPGQGGANNNGGGANGVLMLEGRNARLRVRVGGMPSAPKGGGS